MSIVNIGNAHMQGSGLTIAMGASPAIQVDDIIIARGMWTTTVGTLSDNVNGAYAAVTGLSWQTAYDGYTWKEAIFWVRTVATTTPTLTIAGTGGHAVGGIVYRGFTGGLVPSFPTAERAFNSGSGTSYASGSYQTSAAGGVGIGILSLAAADGGRSGSLAPYGAFDYDSTHDMAFDTYTGSYSSGVPASTTLSFGQTMVNSIGWSVQTFHLYAVSSGAAPEVLTPKRRGFLGPRSPFGRMARNAAGLLVPASAGL